MDALATLSDDDMVACRVGGDSSTSVERQPTDVTYSPHRSLGTKTTAPRASRDTSSRRRPRGRAGCPRRTSMGTRTWTFYARRRRTTLSLGMKMVAPSPSPNASSPRPRTG
jgi:hypothetical protein